MQIGLCNNCVERFVLIWLNSQLHLEYDTCSSDKNNEDIQLITI